MISKRVGIMPVSLPAVFLVPLCAWHVVRAQLISAE